MTLPRTLASLVLLGVATLLGCGGGPGDAPDTAPVTGKITLDNAPLANATVTFQPTSGRPSTDVTDEQGNYDLKFSIRKDGAALGEHVVSITTAGTIEDADGNETEVEEKLPPRYHEEAAENPDMKVTVENKANVFNFDLESK
jgi:hypothetical protein